MPSYLTKAFFLLAAVLALSGCSSQRPLMPTPEIYTLGIKQPFDQNLPASLKTADMNIMYATDRVPEPREDGRPGYGVGRNYTLAIGEAVVNIGGGATWEIIAADARTDGRSHPLNLSISSVNERARGPKSTLVYYGPDGNLVATADGLQKLEVMKSTVHGMIQSRLRSAPRNEILLFVHGVKTSFDVHF